MSYYRHQIHVPGVDVYPASRKGKPVRGEADFIVLFRPQT